jgi:CRISPR-associated protein Csd1
MSWMTKLYDTYDHIVNRCNNDGVACPWPISHFVKNAHIEVVINNAGEYLSGRAKILDSIDSPTLIPASESSAGRSGSKIAPHPLCEEIGYCAPDYPDAKKEKTKAYMEQLNSWVNAHASQLKISAIFKYLSKGTLWKDLSSEFDFPLKVKKFDGTSQKIAAEKVFIRWRVEEPGNPVSGTWEDENLIDSWIAYDKENNSKDGFCYVKGCYGRTASNHPRFLRRPGDGAKLISSNDSSGFTFRGRFTDTKNSIEKCGLQAAGIGFNVTQKAHNALRWLISNQGTTIGKSKDDAGSVVLAWAVSGDEIPQPMKDTWDLLGEELQEMSTPLPEVEKQIDHTIDLGQSFSVALGKYMAGYQAKLETTDNIIIMGLDSATPGRMAVIYYQEFFPEEYIERISQWHNDFAWYQRHKIEKDVGKKKPESRTVWPVCAPSLRSIWEAVYGSTVSDSLKKNTVERILPCIVEARSFPRDLVDKAVRRASNRSAYKSDEQWLWEKNLGIACALYRGFSKRNSKLNKEYIMGLEQDNTSRDYLYGRLLAIAERLEDMSLYVAGENRSTTAARLMQRFADRPSSTWRNIELALQPYIQRLKNNRAEFLHNIQVLLDDVMNKFIEGEFINDKPLSGEFLLAYHSQRLELRNKNKSIITNENDELQIEGDKE